MPLTPKKKKAPLKSAKSPEKKLKTYAPKQKATPKINVTSKKNRDSMVEKKRITMKRAGRADREASRRESLGKKGRASEDERKTWPDWKQHDYVKSSTKR
tara:strand:+ start:2485 stop:2784 length:300 start_codon:yes stop_codon:yes gene_type:complete